MPDMRLQIVQKTLNKSLPNLIILLYMELVIEDNFNLNMNDKI